jgi:hypothetical protein
MTRLARKIGLDGNPLRRRTDKVAARLAALLVAVFLVGAPVLAMAAVGWAGRVAAAEQQAARSWRQVPAVLQQAAPVPAGAGPFSQSWARARWIAPDGRARAGEIPVIGGLAAGRAVPLWVDPAGSPAGPPPSGYVTAIREVAAPMVTTVVLAAVLLCLAWAGRRVVDRQRLAGWEAGWARVGPQWTRRFRSRG